MIIKDLLERMEYQYVHESIMNLYPKECQRVMDGFYKLLWEEIRNVAPIENQNNMTIHVQYVKEHEKAEQYMWNVSYSVDRRFHHQYGLQFATREQIVSAMVKDEDLEVQSAEQYLAHILFDVAREGQMEEQEDGIRSVDPKNHLPHFSDTVEYRSVDEVIKELENDEFIEE
ncbi:DUF6557 family protein [Brevibacillus sp. NPDC058079]|uniref:DUF6557 family protein n=1 Tax=Brevibacillus sp. NPDC058079 TaxID=3346330 RepID=UPI0036E51799